MDIGAYVLDCPKPVELATFYATLLGWQEPEIEPDWVTVRNPQGGTTIDFQLDPDYQPPTWPSPERPQMVHLDFRVTDMDAEHRRAVDLGATLLDDTHPTFRVFTDPAGHPFCLCAC